MANQAKRKKGIDLFVLLIEENTAQIAKFLKGHGVEDAEEYNKQELYNALHNLYFNNPPISQKELDKELAEMHPHKDWILRVVTPEKNEFEIEKIKEAVKSASVTEKKASMEGEEKKSPCDGCQGCRVSSFSNASGNAPRLQVQEPKLTSNEDKSHYLISLIALVAVVGLTYKFVIK